MAKKFAANSVNMAAPSIEYSLAQVAKRFAGHLRVSAKLAGKWHLLKFRNFGDPATWEYDFEGVAASKEAISQRTGQSTREVQHLHPELLEDGDTVYFGSVVSAGGTIVVAYSGVEAYFDEMFAKWVLAAFEALIEHELEQQRATDKERFAL